jgi:hypothetical protein
MDPSSLLLVHPELEMTEIQVMPRKATGQPHVISDVQYEILCRFNRERLEGE